MHQVRSRDVSQWTREDSRMCGLRIRYRSNEIIFLWSLRVRCHDNHRHIRHRLKISLSVVQGDFLFFRWLCHMWRSNQTSFDAAPNYGDRDEQLCFFWVFKIVSFSVPEEHSPTRTFFNFNVSVCTSESFRLYHSVFQRSIVRHALFSTSMYLFWAQSFTLPRKT